MKLTPIGVLISWLVLFLVKPSQCFNDANPFQKPQWAPEVRRDVLNDTYHAAMEQILKLWWRQRFHMSKANHYRDQLISKLEGQEIQSLDELINRTSTFIDEEILIISDIIWGNRSESRSPSDQTKIDKLSTRWKQIQRHLDEHTTLLKDVEPEIENMRTEVKGADEELFHQFAQIQKESATEYTIYESTIKPFKWIQIH